MTTTKVLKFWCEPADDDSKELLMQQISLGYTYARSLDDAENTRRRSFRDHLMDVTPFKEAENELTALYESTSKENRDDAFRTKVELLRSAKKDVYISSKTTEPFVSKIKEDQDRYRAEVRRIRADLGPRGHGLSFGSYQHEEDAHLQSKSTRAPYLPLIRKRLPKEGTFAVHLQSEYKAPIQNVLDGSCRWVSIGSEMYSISRKVKYGSRTRDDSKSRGRRLRQVSLRVSGKGGDTKLIKVHALIHRMPVTGTVVWARIHTQRTGRKLRYSLQISVDNPVFPADVKNIRTAKSGVIGIDLGWRETDEGFLIATASEQNGNQLPPLIIPKEVALRGITHQRIDSRCETLQSTRDQKFNDIINRIRHVRDSAADWFREHTQHCHKWRSPGKVVGLFSKWRNNRWNGDDEIFDATSAFIKKDGHLWDWEAHNRTRMSRQIRGTYQRWADILASNYAEIRIENLDIKQAAEDFRKKAESEHQKDNNKSKSPLIDTRAKLQLAHVGHSLVRSCNRNECNLGRVDKRYTSRKCHLCGTKGKKTSDKLVFCKNKECALYNCAVDRDIRAALNIASSEVLEWVAGPLAAPKEPKERKNPRRRTKQAETISAAA